MTTFEFEDSLPKLKVPSIEATLSNLRACLQPVLTEDLNDELEASINSFRSSEVSRLLQSHLTKLAKNEVCYLNHLNLNHNILISDNALPRNPFLVLENDPKRLTQAERSAVLAVSAVKFIASLNKEVLPPDPNYSGAPSTAQHLSMKPYLNLFKTTRTPDANSLKFVNYKHSNHILIVSHCQYYCLQVLSADNEVLFGIEELADILEEVLADSVASADTDRLAIGAATSDSFKNWKHLRQQLGSRFKSNMNRIDSSLFVLVLDDSSPETARDIANVVSQGSLNINDRGVQTGSCISRWFDKLQLVVTRNAVAGVVWDSYSCDGTSVLRFTADVYTDSILRLTSENQYSIFSGVRLAHTSAKPLVSKLVWDRALAKDLQIALHLSETRLADLICSHSTNIKTLRYGKAFSRKLGLKSDSVVQVGLQVAHYALYGKLIPTIEPISLRYFQNSRCEFLPVQNELILKACQMFISDSSAEERWRHFEDACRNHARQIANYQSGTDGFLNHIKALQNVYLKKELFNEISPEFRIPDSGTFPDLIFNNELLQPLLLPEMIASNCGNPAIRLFGLTPAQANGFGIGYIVKQDETDFTLISQFRQGDRLLSTLDWVLSQLDSLWKELHSHCKVLSHAHELDNKLKTLRASHHSRHLKYTASSTSCNQEDSILGGYGYFDFGELSHRSASQSKHQTPLSSNRSSSVFLNELNSHSSASINANLRSSLLEPRNDPFSPKFDRGQVGRKVELTQ